MNPARQKLLDRLNDANERARIAKRRADRLVGRPDSMRFFSAHEEADALREELRRYDAGALERLQAAKARFGEAIRAAREADSEAEPYENEAVRLARVDLALARAEYEATLRAPQLATSIGPGSAVAASGPAETVSERYQRHGLMRR